MTRLLSLAALFALAIAPAAAPAQMSTSPMMGMGPHGYDFLIGSWTCVNSMPSPVGGPATTQATFSRSSVAGVILARIAGKGFEGLAYIAYTPKTKTWVNPTMLASGDSETEWSTQMGKKVVFSGNFYSGDSGKATKVRDTFLLPSWKKYTDLTEMQAGGAWKAVAKLTCTKT